MEDMVFAFHNTGGLHCKCHRIRLSHVGWYIDSLDWIKNKKETIYLKNEDNKCIQCVVTVVLNHGNIVKDPLQISGLSLFQWNK